MLFFVVVVGDVDVFVVVLLQFQLSLSLLVPGVDDPATLPIPHFMTLVLSRLEHLNQQVGRLTSEVAQLKSRQFGASRAEDPLEGPQSDEGVEERLDAKLDEVFLQIQEVQRQMEEHRSDMESKLHSQHAMLQYNLSSLKTDVDVKLKQHQKMMQVIHLSII